MASSRKKIWMAAAALCLVSCIIFASSGAVAKQLAAWDLLPKPEPYTEFFFNDFQTIPTHVAPNATVAADMTVRNMQHEPTTYTYKIIATDIATDKQHILKDGSCTAAPAAICTLDGTITMPPLGPHIQVRTTIDYDGRRYDEPARRPQSQSLHYWVSLDLPAGDDV